MTIGPLSARAGVRLGGGGALPVVAAAFGALAVGWLLTEPDGQRVALAVSIAVLLLGVGAIAPMRLVVALIAWLALLGLVRRIVPGGTAGTDPLLVIGPIAMAGLVVLAARAGAFARRSHLANGVLLLSGLIALSALNPLQGSLLTGLAGLVLTLVPVSAFWVGRAFLDDARLTRMLAVIGVLAVGGAVYGLTQTLLGFPAWDAAWIQASDYAALNVDGVTRPFASFSSAADYTTFIAVGIVVLLAVASRAGRATVPALVGLAVLLPALALASSRGSVVLLVVAFAAMVAARARLGAPAAIAGAALLLVLLPVLVARVVPAATGEGVASSLIEHQVQGLADPFDEESSTLGGHLDLFTAGMRSALDDPLGIGIGSVTIAADRFGGDLRGTEVDPSNIAVAAGLPGLLVFLWLLGHSLWRTYRLASFRADPLALAALGVLAVTFLQWLNGGQYAVAILPWLFLGWVDAAHGPPRRGSTPLGSRSRAGPDAMPPAGRAG